MKATDAYHAIPTNELRQVVAALQTTSLRLREKHLPGMAEDYSRAAQLAAAELQRRAGT
jgi:hypothetical protein